MVVNIMEHAASRHASDKRFGLLWPAIVIASLAAYGVSVKVFGFSYETALQAHFLILFATIFAIERMIPYHRIWNIHDRQAINDTVYNITFTLAQLAAGSVAIWLVSRVAGPWAWLSWDFKLPFSVQFVALALILELISYVHHRCFHTFEALWKFHSLHHSSEQLHILNNARVHPVEVFIAFLPILIFVAAVRVPADLLHWYLCLQLTVGLLTHSNIAAKSGAFSYVFNTPELHQWHHSLLREEHDNNYGSTLMIWDHVFGSYFNPAKRSPSVKIGATTQVPQSLLAQLLFPFRRTR